MVYSNRVDLRSGKTWSSTSLRGPSHCRVPLVTVRLVESHFLYQEPFRKGTTLLGYSHCTSSGVVAHSPYERRLPTDRWARGCLHRERSKARETIRAWWPLDLETRPRCDPGGPPRFRGRDFVFPTWFKCTAKNNSAVFNAFAGQLPSGSILDSPVVGPLKNPLNRTTILMPSVSLPERKHQALQSLGNFDRRA